MEWLLAVALKPLIFVGVFFFAYVVARLAHRAIPDGKLKRLLYDRSLRARHPWKFGLGFLIAGYAVIGLIACLVW
jgi:hypothetical protein